MLEERVDGVWVGRAAKPRDVGVALGDMLGLGAQQFQQVILLAQNKFSRFRSRPAMSAKRFFARCSAPPVRAVPRRLRAAPQRDAQKMLDGAAAQARRTLLTAERMVEEQRNESGLDPDGSGAGAGAGAGADAAGGATGAAAA